MQLLDKIRQWAEVWPLLIPLSIFIIYRDLQKDFRPLLIYTIIAFCLSLPAVVIQLYNQSLPSWLQNNLILYNIHSFVRVILFTWFIAGYKMLRPLRSFLLVIPLYTLFILINFIFLESPLSFSTNSTAAESIVLLALCISFYLFTIRDDSDIIWMKQPVFLIATGVSLYEAINFLIFLFFHVIFWGNHEFGFITMQVFSISYVIFCLLLAIALVRSRKKNPLSA